MTRECCPCRRAALPPATNAGNEHRQRTPVTVTLGKPVTVEVGLGFAVREGNRTVAAAP
ncbi:MAG TPA: hypothetical protein VGB74_09485 [Actinoplanes sp.]